MLQNGSSWEHMYFYQNANYICPLSVIRQDTNYICPHFVSALCMELVIYTDQTPTHAKGSGVWSLTSDWNWGKLAPSTSQYIFHSLNGTCLLYIELMGLER